MSTIVNTDPSTPSTATIRYRLQQVTHEAVSPTVLRIDDPRSKRVLHELVRSPAVGLGRLRVPPPGDRTCAGCGDRAYPPRVYPREWCGASLEYPPGVPRLQTGLR
jgi:hypothetical protein